MRDRPPKTRRARLPVNGWSVANRIDRPERTEESFDNAPGMQTASHLGDSWLLTGEFSNNLPNAHVCPPRRNTFEILPGRGIRKAKPKKDILGSSAKVSFCT